MLETDTSDGSRGSGRSIRGEDDDEDDDDEDDDDDTPRAVRIGSVTVRSGCRATRNALVVVVAVVIVRMVVVVGTKGGRATKRNDVAVRARNSSNNNNSSGCRCRRCRFCCSGCVIPRRIVVVDKKEERVVIIIVDVNVNVVRCRAWLLGTRFDPSWSPSGRTTYPYGRGRVLWEPYLERVRRGGGDERPP